jgi:hypothetical protein
MLKSIQEWIILLVIFGVIALFGNWVGFEVMPIVALPGMIVLVLICLIGLMIHKLLPFKIPSVAYIAIIGVVVSASAFPGSEKVVEWTTEVNLLALATPILAYAGIAIGRSWTDFKKLGWRSLVVAVFVLLGTFIGSALIAEVILRMQGII